MNCDSHTYSKSTSRTMRFANAFVTSAIACVIFAIADYSDAATTFLNHFDIGNPINNGAGAADYAVGNSAELILPPSGPGGTIVAGGKFGNALNRPSGRVEYAVANNFNVLKGTIEMWIKGPGVADDNFRALWGTNTNTGAGDIRLYVYNDQVNDNLRSLGAYQNGAGGSHWEIERPIPVELLDNENWHHVAWAYDTTAGSEKTALWWDGVLLGSAADDGTTINPRTSFSATRMHIGEAQGGSATWPGFIDEFRISDDVVYDVEANFTPQTTPFASPVPVIVGDFDNDYDVDGADFLIWQRSFGASVPPGTDPDASGNGLVDVDDLTLWKSNFGFASTIQVATAVPEPGCLAVLTALAPPFLVFSRYHREL